jgi:hypothetical protein
MKYLQYRNDYLTNKVQIKKENIKNYFKNSSLIKESVTSVTNDITWGGSLLGRLVNSIIRKATIYTKYLQINKPLAEFEAALTELVQYAGLSEDVRKEQYFLLFKSLLTEIYNIVFKSDSLTIGKKKAKLIGDGDGGLVGELIKKLQAEKFEIEDKEELIKKLEKFRDLLKEIEEESTPDTGENEEDEETGQGQGQGQDEGDDGSDEREKKDAIFKFYKSTLTIFKSMIKFSDLVENKRVMIQGQEEPEAKYKLGNFELKPGQVYTYNSAKGGSSNVILLSLKNEIIPGKDDQGGGFLDGGVKVKNQLKPGTVYVLPEKCPRCNGVGEVTLVDKTTKKQSKQTCDLCNGKKVIVVYDNAGKILADETEKIVRKAFNYPKDGKLLPIAKPFVALVKSLQIKGKGGGKLSTNTGVNVGKKVPFWRNDFQYETLDWASFFEKHDLADTSNPNRRGTENVAKIQSTKKVTDESGKESQVKVESDATNVWRKIMKAYKEIKMPELVGALKNLIEKSQRGSKVEKGDFMIIGKEIIQNEATLGKPVPFEKLIKEDKKEKLYIPLLEIAKKISLFSRVVVDLKEDLGILGSFGLARQPLKDFIEAYGEMKEVYGKVKNVKSEPIESEKKKEGEDSDKDSKKENRLTIFNYEKFRLYEELQDEEEDEEGLEDIEEDEESQEEEEKVDKIKNAWNQSFEKGDVDKYIVENGEVEAHNRKADAELSKEFNIDVNKGPHKDLIMKIINAFGKAYRLYATDFIPSGRPGGRVSLKTFREYEYIGDSDSGRSGDWQEGQTPGRGPWAVSLIFNAWDDGVTEILEEPKFKSILQNAKFVYPGGRKEGSGSSGGDRDDGYNASGATDSRREIKAGRSLFDFINEMINPEGGFKKSRRKIMKEWFGGIDKIEGDKEIEEDKDRYSKIKIPSEEKGEAGQVSFVGCNAPGLKETWNGGKVENFFTKYENCFFKIKIYDHDKKEERYLKGYVWADDGKKIYFKLNNTKGERKDKIVKTYLGGENDKSYKDNEKPEYDTTLTTYVLSIPYAESVTLNRNMKAKQAEIIGNNQVGNSKDVEYKVMDINILVKNKDEKTFIKLEYPRPSKLLNRDIEKLIPAVTDKFK